MIGGYLYRYNSSAVFFVGGEGVLTLQSQAFFVNKPVLRQPRTIIFWGEWAL